MDQESSTNGEIQGSVFQISYSFSFFVEAYNALLNCLGLGRLAIVDHQSTSHESSSTSSPERQENGRASEESSQDLPPPTTDPDADPSTDNSEDPPTDTASALARRSPPVSSGRGGQINSTPA